MGKIDIFGSGADAIYVMSEGNPGAIVVLLDMLKDPEGPKDMLMLDEKDIRGAHIYMLNNDCCKRDPIKFKRTLEMIRTGLFTDEQIKENLTRCYALPFIDDEVRVDGVDLEDEEFGPKHPKWGEWCEAQKEAYAKRTAS